MKELGQIYALFFRVGLFTFGGGYAMLPILQREVVDQRGWVEEQQLSDFYAVAQCLPGLIATNMAMLIAHPRRGAAGALAAVLGVVTPSILIILLIASVLDRFMHLPLVLHAFHGIRVAVAALVVQAVWRMAKQGVRDLAGLVIALAALALTMFTGLNPIFVILGAALAGILLRRWQRRAER